MRLPKFKLSQTRDYTQVFGGLNRQMRPSENEFSDMKNLTSTYYPTLSPRDPRGIVGTIDDCNGLLGKENLAWVDGNTLHYGDSFTMELDADVSGERQLVSMGAYLIIHPDMMYVNTVELSDHGYIKQDGVTWDPPMNIRMDISTFGVSELDGYAISDSRFVYNPGTYSKGIYIAATNDIGEINTVVLDGVPSPNDPQMAELFDIQVFLYEDLATLDPDGVHVNGYVTIQTVADVEYGTITEPTTVGTIRVSLKDSRFEWVASYVLWVCGGVKNTDMTFSGYRTCFLEDGSVGLEYIDATTRVVTRYDTYTYIYSPGIGLVAGKKKFMTLSFGENCSSALKLALKGIADTNDGAVRWGDTYAIEVVSLDKIKIKGGITLSTSIGTSVFEKGLLSINFYDEDLPIMDYLIAAGNRLWGCRYGLNRNGDFVNEIYASAQGSFRDWTQFQGISTDSYTVSLGTDGPFTGAVTYRDMPYFFKERCVHTVYGTLPENYQTSVDSSVGLQKGSHKSLCVLGNLLYFKSPDGIFRYDGSTSEELSRALGYEVFTEAIGGGLDGKYYIAQTAENGTRAVYVYDTEKGLWHIEEGAGVRFFARHGHDLYVWDSETKQLCTVRGTEGTAEEGPIEWYADSGIFGYTSPDRKYVGRVQLRIQLPEGSEVRFYIEYDGDGYWDFQGSMTGHGLQSFTVPIRPRRCDHFRIRLEGSGPCKLFSLAKVLEEGGYGV